jgi:hypothetical protein
MMVQRRTTGSARTMHGLPPSPHLDSCPSPSTPSPLDHGPSLSLQLSLRSPNTPEPPFTLCCPSPTLSPPTPHCPSTPPYPHWDSSPTSTPPSLDTLQGFVSPSLSLQLSDSSPVVSPRLVDSTQPLHPLSLSQPLSPECHFRAEHIPSLLSPPIDTVPSLMNCPTNAEVLSLQRLQRSLYTLCTHIVLTNNCSRQFIDTTQRYYSPLLLVTSAHLYFRDTTTCIIL